MKELPTIKISRKEFDVMCQTNIDCAYCVFKSLCPGIIPNDEDFKVTIEVENGQN